MNSGNRKKWSFMLLAVFVAAVAVFALQQNPQVNGPPSAAGLVAGKPERAQVFLGPVNSIAVLPFTGVSENEDQSFWAYGFSSELHRLVTRAPGLQVTSRNSSFFFRDQLTPLPIVAERLQARYLLFGDILVTDGDVKVSATLFDAKRKEDAWTSAFEGDLNDMFQIQDRILAGSVETVRPRGRHDLPESRPVDGEAWAEYLKGLYHRAQKTVAGFESAEQAFLTALEIEPGFAMAWVGLAGLRLEMNAAGAGDTGQVDAAREALEAALRAEPDLPEALGLLSYVRRNEDWDWLGAMEAAREAMQLSPGDPELMSIASLAMFSLGKFEEAGDMLGQSVRQDPLNLSRRLQLGLLQEFAGQNDKALSNYRIIIGLNPDYPGVRAYRARIKIIQGKAESALKESEQEPDPFWKRYAQILAYTLLGREEQALPLLDRMIAEDGGYAAYQLAEIMAFRGEAGLAFEWLQLAYEQRDGGMSEVIGNYFLGNLHNDPRWAELLIRLDLPLPAPID